MFEVDFLEWIGYAASILVLISLLMSSILKLRWINLVGSTLFSIYGFSIGALPVGIVNLAIVLINIYYLIKIYSQKESFKILKVKRDNPYIKYFLDFYKDSVNKHFPHLNVDTDKETLDFFILRNVVPAGLFLAKKYDDNSLFIDLDFVMPEYRDFKIGQYIFEGQRKYFLDAGYTRLLSEAHDEVHENYLVKMGFEKAQVDGKTMFIKNI